MKTIKKALWLLSALPVVFISSGGAAKAEIGAEGPDESVLVGRISRIEGQLLRHQPGDEDWTPTLEDTPLGAGESLYTEKDSRAEIILPNSTWARLDGRTQIHLLELREDLTDLDLGSGTGRFFSKGGDSLIKVRTLFGHVTAPAGTAFDLHVYANAVEVIGLQGRVSFWQGNTDQRFEVTAGSGSIVADTKTVSVGKGHEPQGWEAWNRERDALWAQRMTSGGVSAAYLPPTLSDEAYVLEENGVWERAYYGNGYYDFWRPTRVGAGWTPFTVGCWDTWYHESTWVPYEPFGYVTHHYGNWVFIGHSWYWAPPVARGRPHVGRPLFGVGFAWYPGRVAWIHLGTNVGWVPLAPHEPYYAHRRWGHKAVAVRDANVTNLDLNVTRYENHRHAVVIDRNDLHRVRDYRTIRIKSDDRASAASTYHVVPFLDRLATRPNADVMDAHMPSRAVRKQKSHFVTAEKDRQKRFEGVYGANLQAAKVGQALSTGPRSAAGKRPQVQPRNKAGVSIESVRPILMNSSPPMRAQTVAESKRRETSENSVEIREVQKSIALGQPNGTKADRRSETSQVSKTPGGMRVERHLSKPADGGRMGSKYQSSPGKLKENVGLAESKSPVVRAKGVASDNIRTVGQAQRTRVRMPSTNLKGGIDQNIPSGAGRLQPSSRGATNTNARGFFRK